MAISNTFSTPQASKSFTLSLVDFNNSSLALWSNFYGPSVPTINNITIAGTPTTPYAGMLYRSSLTNAFYVYDPTNAKSGGVGGGFTRMGIGSRNFESITALVSNIATIEQAELVTTVGTSSANYRVYMKVNNSSSIVDIGVPASGSLVTSMFANRQISNLHIQAASITGFELAANIVYNSTLNLTKDLDMDANVSFGTASRGLRFFDGSTQNSAPTTIQVARTTTITFVTTAGTGITVDNSIPAITEGDEFTQLATSFTPVKSTSKLRIDIEVMATRASGPDNCVIACFQDALTDAIAARAVYVAGPTSPTLMRLSFVVDSSSTTARTYTVRVGSNTPAAMYLNGWNNGTPERLMGGVMRAFMNITEYNP